MHARVIPHPGQLTPVTRVNKHSVGPLSKKSFGKKSRTKGSIVIPTSIAIFLKINLLVNIV